MINGSIAVLTRPSVATFEEHEQNNLGWATIYVAIGAVLAGIFGAIAFAVQRPFIEQELGQFEEEFGMQLDVAAAQPTITGAIFSNLFGTLLGFFIFLGIVYLLGRAFGGTGNFGELAFDISLFWTPLLVLRALLGILAFGPILSAILGFVSLAIGIYNIYLTYLGIQSGMNLPGNKALYVILILVGIVILLGICVAVIFGAAIAALMSQMQ